MEKELRNSYYISFVIVILLLYFLLKKEGGMSMGVLVIFCVTSVPFLLINLMRSLSKVKVILFVLNLIYLLLLSTYCLLNLDKEDWLLVFVLGLTLITILTVEFVRNKKFIILNYFSYIHLILFLIYVIL